MSKIVNNQKHMMMSPRAFARLAMSEAGAQVICTDGEPMTIDVSEIPTRIGNYELYNADGKSIGKTRIVSEDADAPEVAATRFNPAMLEARSNSRGNSIVLDALLTNTKTATNDLFKERERNDRLTKELEDARNEAHRLKDEVRHMARELDKANGSGGEIMQVVGLAHQGLMTYMQLNFQDELKRRFDLAFEVFTEEEKENAITLINHPAFRAVPPPPLVKLDG